MVRRITIAISQKIRRMPVGIGALLKTLSYFDI
jgi:hypothetical protein